MKKNLKKKKRHLWSRISIPPFQSIHSWGPCDSKGNSWVLQESKEGPSPPSKPPKWMVYGWFTRETPIFKWMIWGVENPYFWVDTHVPGDSFWPFYGWWVSSRDPFKWLSDVKWLPTFGDEKITVIESPDMESSPEMFFSERSVWKKHVFVGSCFKRAIYSDHSPPVGHPKWWFSKGIPPKWP